MHRRSSFVISALAVLAGSTSFARAQVGEPFGSYSIRITQGGVVRIENPSVIVPPDLKPAFIDGDPEDFVVIGHLPPGAPDINKPVIVKLTTDGGPVEFDRFMHIYIDVPFRDGGGNINLNLAGPESLLDPNNPGPVTIEINGMQFNGTPAAEPFMYNVPSFFSSYMRDKLGRYYYTPGVNAFNSYGHGANDIQVPAPPYLDVNPSPYNFLGSCGGAKVGWSWLNLINPGPATPVADPFNSGAPIASSSGGGTAGFVFELALAAVFERRTPVTTADIPNFVDVLNGIAVASPLCRYDFNHDGVVNALDIPGFIDEIF